MSGTTAVLLAPKVNERSHREAPTRPVHIRFVGDREDAFRRTLTARMEDYLERTGKTRFADAGIWLKTAIYSAALIAAYIAMLNQTMWRSYGLFAILCGVAALLLAMNAGHDAAHGVLTGRRKPDAVIHRFLFALVGVDGYLWQMRHNGSHHAFPNVNGCDIDIDENPFLRLSPNHPRTWYQRWQHIYAVPIYGLTLLHSIFAGDYIYLRKKHLANMRDITHRPRDVAGFVLAKIFHFGFHLGVPLLLVPLPWWQIVLSYVAATAAASIVFIFLLVGTHFSVEAEFPIPTQDGEIFSSWARHAVVTSVDWLPESPFAVFLAGGANAHAAHHLFPRQSHAHSIAASRIIRETAREFGVAYHATNFSGMIAAHFRHLKAMAA